MGGLESWVLGYLVNSVWQVPLVFGVAWVCARMVRASGPSAEHRVWLTALLLESMLPGVPAGSWGWVRAMLAFVRGGAAGGDGTVSVAMGGGFAAGLSHVPGWLGTAVCVAYGAVLVYFGARLGWGVWRIGRLRRESTAVALTGEAGAFWEQCSRRFGVREVELAASADVHGPMTAGVWRRLVLVPVEIVSGVDGEAMRTVMAHELAHVARRDFAWNLLYEVLAVPVLYHRVFRLTQARMRESREAVAMRWPQRRPAGARGMHGTCCGWPPGWCGEGRPGKLTPSESSMPTHWRGELCD